jgi:hypothetical protein
MAMPNRKSARLFLADYKTDADPLLNPDTERGRPGLLPARDPDGRIVLVKFWPRQENAGGDDLEQFGEARLGNSSASLRCLARKSCSCRWSPAARIRRASTLFLTRARGALCRYFDGQKCSPPFLPSHAFREIVGGFGRTQNALRKRLNFFIHKE